jgi:hypothetical protein
MAQDDMTIPNRKVFIHIRRIHRTDEVSEEEASTHLERHRHGDWGESHVKAPGENERSIFLNFNLTSFVLSEYRQEPEEQSIMIFTALYTGRTVIFRRGELCFSFIATHLCEMLDLAGGD